MTSRPKNTSRPAAPAEGAVFRSNRSQAVRIPKALAFPDSVKRVRIVEQDGALVLMPIHTNWTDYFARTTRLSDDFPTDIPDQPPDPVESLD